MLPTAAAAALVVTATGATVAESAVPVAAPLTLDLSGQQSETVRTEQAADEATVIDLAVRRQDSSMQTAALQGRVEAQQRAARDAKRKAAAQAKAKREGKKWVKAIRSGRQTSDFGPRCVSFALDQDLRTSARRTFWSRSRFPARCSTRSSPASTQPESAEILEDKKRRCAGSSGASTMLGALVQSIGYFREEESAYQRKRQN